MSSCRKTRPLCLNQLIELSMPFIEVLAVQENSNTNNELSYSKFKRQSFADKKFQTKINAKKLSELMNSYNELLP